MNTLRLWILLTVIAVGGTAALLFGTNQTQALPPACSLNTDCGCSAENADCDMPPAPGFCDLGLCDCNPGFGGIHCTALTPTPTATTSATPTRTQTSTPTETPTTAPNENSGGAIGCNDMIDNDLDLLIDCADPDCADIPPCGAPAPAASSLGLAALVAGLGALGWLRLRRNTSRT